jgi:hypothetical protein
MSGIKSLEKFDMDLDHTEIYFRNVKDGEQVQVYLDTEHKDNSLLIYPLHVLATNRMCDTMNSKKPGTAMFKFPADFVQIRSASSLFAGLLPYSINYLINNIDLQIFKKEDGLFT